MKSNNLGLIIIFLIVIGMFGVALMSPSGDAPAPSLADLEDEADDVLTPDEGRAEIGYEIAMERCAGCHEIGLRGNSPIPEAPTFGALAARWPVEYLAESLAEGIQVRHGDDIEMPTFVFTVEEVDDFLAYLDSLK